MNFLEQDTIYYTDGGCRGNPGPGGYGIIGLRGDEIVYAYSAFEDATTNNRMELKAILHVLKLAAENPQKQYTIYSDSSYAIQSITQWIYTWANNGWQNSKKVTVENIDIMKEIWQYVAFPPKNVKIHKVRGHCGNLGNELVDALCTNNMDKYYTLITANHLKV